MLKPTTDSIKIQPNKTNEIPKNNVSKPTKSPNLINSKPSIQKTQISNLKTHQIWKTQILWTKKLFPDKQIDPWSIWQVVPFTLV